MQKRQGKPIGENCSNHREPPEKKNDGYFRQVRKILVEAQKRTVKMEIGNGSTVYPSVVCTMQQQKLTISHNHTNKLIDLK